MTPDQSTTDDIVAESALQLWSAAQTDFDPFEVDSSDWPETAVPVRDADIAVDTRLEVDDVRAALERLDGVKVVVGREAGTRQRAAGGAGGHAAVAGCRSSACTVARRTRNARSSSRLRRSQPVTSSLHLLALHEAHAGTTLSSV